MKKIITFTKEQLIEGSRLAKENSLFLAEQALFLLKKKEYVTTALGLYSFAIEEWGKHLILNEHLSTSNYTVNMEVFGKSKKPHNSKFNRGLNDLPHFCKIFTKPIDVSSAIKSGKPVYLGKPSSKDYTHYGLSKSTFRKHEYSIGNFSIDFEARKDCFYVDWSEELTEWKPRLLVSGKNLKIAIKNFLNIIKSRNDS